MDKGIIFNLQKFCLNDGPGIRTTVFLKGCPLKCKWCHNPESQSRGVELLRENGVQEVCGTETTAQEILNEVLKDRVFYENSGGGLTLSGGEPMMQFEFAYEILKLAKQNGIHTCLETCGFSKTEDIVKIAGVTDLFLYDWKLSDPLLHKEYTGADNALIRENLRQIDAAGSKTILRCPIIPDVNDTEEHFRGIAKTADSLRNILAIEIMPYHSLGTGKYRKLGREQDLPAFQQPDERQVANWITQIQTHTKTPVRKA